MMTALTTKNKVGMVDGSVPRPPEGDPNRAQWYMFNALELLLAATRLPGELGVEGNGGERKIRVFREKGEKGHRGSTKLIRWAAAWRWPGPEQIRWAAGPSGPFRAVKSGFESD
ncbi:hypothetical protein CRG98_018114 [Punica granatum]|uniref:Uncharacterized protein n=1 Tax=Punica granatum TaxID=22663 RepID=A0A2I0JYS6_PUNGR|nr:hypothetical protein CRG98_018114 [Punica granatum]